MTFDPEHLWYQHTFKTTSKVSFMSIFVAIVVLLIWCRLCSLWKWCYQSLLTGLFCWDQKKILNPFHATGLYAPWTHQKTRGSVAWNGWRSHQSPEKPYKNPFQILSIQTNQVFYLPSIFNKTIFESDFPWNTFTNISKKTRVGIKSQNDVIYKHFMEMLAQFATIS